MARAGSFQGPSEGYAMPSSSIYPADANFKKAMYAPELLKLDKQMKLTDAEMDRLQAEIDELVGTARMTEQFT
jgi:hypothetical protein